MYCLRHEAPRIWSPRRCGPCYVLMPRRPRHAGRTLPGPDISPLPAASYARRRWNSGGGVGCCARHPACRRDAWRRRLGRREPPLCLPPHLSNKWASVRPFWNSLRRMGLPAAPRVRPNAEASPLHSTRSPHCCCAASPNARAPARGTAPPRSTPSWRWTKTGHRSRLR